MQPPAIVVGLVTRNRAEILPKAIASALAQRVPNLQVAVIDDGSTDGTAGLAAQYPQVRWSRRPASLGYMTARNEMMSLAGFDYFVSLDDDAWFLQEDEIAIAVEYLERHPRVAAVAFDILSPARPEPVPREQPGAVAIFVGCGHVLRLSAVRTVGAYEATPGSWGSEEKDLCIRLLDAGYGVVKLPGVHVWHDKTPVARELLTQYRSSVCNDLTLTFRRTPGLFVVPGLLLKVAQHLRLAWKRRIIGLCCEGIGLFIRCLPQLWSSRRAVKWAAMREFMRLSRL